MADSQNQIKRAQDQRKVAAPGLSSDWWTNPILNPDCGEVEPTNKATGMIAFADGTNWNPNSDGAGYYFYTGSAWVKLIKKTDTLEISAVAAGLSASGSILRVKILNIGAWNMDSTTIVTVAHGLTTSKIRSVEAYINADDAVGFYMLPIDLHDISETHSRGYVYISSADVVLVRNAGMGWDNVNYDSTTAPANRGFIILRYVD